MLRKRYESTEVDRRSWLHVPSGSKREVRGMFEIRKFGDKTSSGEIGLDIEHMQVSKWDRTRFETRRLNFILLVRNSSFKLFFSLL